MNCLKVISVRDETYEKLKIVKEMMNARSLGETIDRLIEVYRKTRKGLILELIKRTKLPEEEVEKVERTVSEVSGREWW